jgi:hypothetical protein
MGMLPDFRMYQPISGTFSNSRFRRKTGSSSSKWKTSVSHADWCLAAITAAPWGKFSRPITRQRRP